MKQISAPLMGFETTKFLRVRRRGRHSLEPRLSVFRRFLEIRLNYVRMAPTALFPHPMKDSFNRLITPISSQKS